MNQSLSDALEQIAAAFRGLGTPEPIVHWGHPVMMGIVVLVMGSYTAYAGWQSRLRDFQKINYSCSRIIIILGV